MLPIATKSPSAGVGEQATRPGEQRASVQSPPDVAMSHRDQNHLTSWADTSGQLDYFASAYNNDSIYNTAITPGGTFVSISPIRKSGNSANAAAGSRTYPSQELNPRYGSLQQLSPPTRDAYAQPACLPPPLPPPTLEGLAHIASTFHPQEVSSEATTGLTQELRGLSTQMNRGSSPNAAVLDSFELDGLNADAIPTGQTKTEGLDDYYAEYNTAAPARVSTSPVETSKARASKGRKKAKGKGKNGEIRPTGLDILRGRGGLTNRHEGNMKFRDEARSMRGEYRAAQTSRREKFELSKALVKRVKEYGGRFLEKGPDHQWREMSEKDARKKASQVLREEKWD